MNLTDLRQPEGAKRKPKRWGNGAGSGNGRYCGRGIKGYKSRSGSSIRAGFEGGQMPLVRRVPKRGFNNARFARRYQVVNLADLCEIFEAGSTISPLEIFAVGLVRSMNEPVKVLADGDMSHKLTIKAHAFSAKALEKIKAAGGDAEVI